MLSMTSAEIGGFLERQETGVLASCSDGDAYGTPESFGYRNGRIYFLLDMPSNSQKRAFVDDTDTVCFTVYEANTRREFASVLVRGTLNRLPEDGAEAEIAVGQNEQFPSEHVFPERGGDTLREYELVVEEISGRKGPDFEVETALAPVVADAN
ncbi:pyridoxamine 5'-phosphate oxidase family protein [Haloplanus sp. GCM10025708]|uniref:pyridoxamine 5'-phosphate oxidase family protein n=1 Tax=Haloferacaceae TaxID=1644056 RepID=UPI003616F739